FWRQRGEIGEDESAHGQYVSALNLQAREFKPIPGGKYTIKARFEANDGEKLFGMGQFWRQRGEIGEDESAHGQYVSALNLQAREFKPI
ncbi:hypothetical protein CQA18_26610, partial [Enterobacter hormaechei]|uniref:hypothetical protein n=1 Tax=Enterobacter hormaechei TaxID=158836 RepID=UPI000BD71D3E